jgi:Raf kinase inhibitor-like YbhB/YbcL family protein
MLELRSQGFEHGSDIPALYTCDGGNISPPLIWTGVPEGGRSLVLIVDDPDVPDPRAPTREWVHWILYNIPAGLNELPQGMGSKDFPPGALAGRNDWGKSGYGGPCPPIGRHRYFHKLYALDTMLPDLSLPDKTSLLEVMDGHVLAECELVGTYCRTRCTEE